MIIIETVKNKNNDSNNIINTNNINNNSNYNNNIIKNNSNEFNQACFLQPDELLYVWSILECVIKWLSFIPMNPQRVTIHLNKVCIRTWTSIHSLTRS